MRFFCGEYEALPHNPFPRVSIPFWFRLTPRGVAKGKVGAHKMVVVAHYKGIRIECQENFLALTFHPEHVDFGHRKADVRGIAKPRATGSDIRQIKYGLIVRSP